VFDGKPDNSDHWGIKWNAFVEVEGISGALGDTLSGYMPEDFDEVIPDTALLTNGGNAKVIAVKDNKKCIAYYAIALKQMKLVRLLTNENTVKWPGGGAWKINKARVVKYRPDDVLTVSELKKRLNNVTLKGNQDTADLFEELTAIDHVYSETAATLGTQDLIGTVLGAAPEKYHTVLNVTTDIKWNNLDIDDLEKVMSTL
jgi:hypothetical protein